MRNPRELKFFLTLFICTVFIFCFSTYGAVAYGYFFGETNQYANNTKIGTVDISGLNSKDALSLLSKKQSSWSSQTKMEMKFKEKSVNINLDLFEFQLEKSLQSAKSGQQTELYVDINEKELESFLHDLSPDILNEKVMDISKLKTDLQAYASLLTTGTHTVQLEKYLLKKQPVVVISESSIPYNENDFELSNWVEKFPQIEIKPETSFSLMQFLEENQVKDFSDESLSMIATAIYKVVLPTNFVITERHISRELPAYAEAGLEAKVNVNNNMDFIFANANHQAYQLNFKIINKLFYVSLKGTKFQYTYNINLKDKEIFQPKTIIQYDAKLPFNSEKLKTTGKEGIVIKVYRDTVDANDNMLETTFLSEDFYPPVNRVMIHSLLTKDSSFQNADTDIDKNGGNETTSEPSTNNTSDSNGNQNGENVGDSGQSAEGNTDSNSMWGKPNELPK